MNKAVEPTVADTETPEVENLEQAETPEQLELVETQEEQEEAATSEEDVEKPKEKKGFKRRIHELSRKQYEAEQRAEQLQRQLDEYQKPQAPEQAQMPTLAEYGYDEAAYQQAVQTWHTGQFEKQQQELADRQQQAVLQQQAQQKQVELNTKLMEAQEKYPDLMVKLQTMPNLEQVNAAAFEAVADSEVFADLANYLASNPNEVYEFASMTPVQAVKKVASIERKFDTPAAPSKPPATPPKVVGGKADVAPDLDNLSDADYERQWRAGKT